MIPLSTNQSTSGIPPKMSVKDIYYSTRYSDDTGEFEYRHVILPKDIAKKVPKRLMSEQEWRGLGVQQSQGWEHYMRWDPEPHILLFKKKVK